MPHIYGLDEAGSQLTAAARTVADAVARPRAAAVDSGGRFPEADRQIAGTELTERPIIGRATPSRKTPAGPSIRAISLAFRRGLCDTLAY